MAHFDLKAEHIFFINNVINSFGFYLIMYYVYVWLCHEDYRRLLCSLLLYPCRPRATRIIISRYLD